jgi:hypothetical protein
MALSYKFAKIAARIRRRFRTKTKRSREKVAFKSLSAEQLKVFNIVKDLAMQNNDAIKFDPKSSESLIVIPDKLLVTMKNEQVRIDNSRGFMSIQMPSEAFDMLIEIVEAEAHKDRRKIKQDVKLRLHSFLDDIIENEIKNTENEHR